MSGGPLLVRGLNWLGDAVMSLPALAALAEAGIKYKISTRSAAAAVYAAAAGAPEVIVEEKGLGGRLRTIGKLAQSSFGEVLILTGSFSSALSAFLARIPERTGYARDFRSLLLTRAVPLRPVDLNVHQSFYFLRLVEALGIEAPFTRPVLTPPAEGPPLPAGFKLALAPGAAYGGAKRWPAKNFAKAAELILSGRKGCAVILGGAAETEAAGEVEDLLKKGPEVVNLAGRTTLPQAMAALSRCHLTLANDSGLMHLSGALGVPVAAVFGPTDPLTTSPLSRRRAILRKPVPCSPCLKRECPRGDKICLEGLTPLLAAEAAEKLLSPVQTGRGAVFWAPGPEGYPPDLTPPAKWPLSTPPGEAGGPIGHYRSEAFRRFLTERQINPAASFWMGDTPESLAPAGFFGGRTILLMTGRALADPARFRALDPTPDLVAPDPVRAFQWLEALGE